MYGNEKRSRVYSVPLQLRHDLIPRAAELLRIDRDAKQPGRHLGPFGNRLQPKARHSTQTLAVQPVYLAPSTDQPVSPLQLSAQKRAGHVGQPVVVPNHRVEITALRVHALVAQEPNPSV